MMPPKARQREEAQVNEQARPPLKVLGPADDAPADWRIGPYEVKEQIGQGGMATVYRAWHTGLHRHEALKIPRRGLDGVDTEYIQRLLSEARLAARLHHPHIVGIHNISEDGAPHPYFSMDLVEGGDLSHVLKERGALPLEETLPILRQAASALSHAHANGIVHRDIKPENILLQKVGDERRVKVVDFGISKAAEDVHGTRLTRSGILVGTPEYMSPEQSGSGEPVDHRTDIYSLGVLAYEMLTGTPPFVVGDGVSRMAVLISHVREEPKAPHEINPQVPPAISAVVLKALSKHPGERFASADEFLAALDEATPREVAAALPPVPLTTQQKLRGGWVALVLAVTIGGLIGWLASTWANHASPDSVAPVISSIVPAAQVRIVPKKIDASALALPAVVKKRQTVQRVTSFPRITRKDTQLGKGQRKTVQRGQNGLNEDVLEIATRGGKPVSRRVLSTRVLKAPVPQIEAVGEGVLNIDNVPLAKSLVGSSNPTTLGKAKRTSTSAPRRTRRRRVKRRRSSSYSSSRSPSSSRRTRVKRRVTRSSRPSRSTSSSNRPSYRVKPGRKQVFGSFRLPAKRR